MFQCSAQTMVEQYPRLVTTILSEVPREPSFKEVLMDQPLLPEDICQDPELEQSGSDAISKQVQTPMSVLFSKEMFHITDWLPTLLSASGSSSKKKLQDIDGVDQWTSLSRGLPTPRKIMVYNLKILPVEGAIRVGDFKLMFGRDFKKDGWYDTDINTFPKGTFRRGNRMEASNPFGYSKDMVFIRNMSHYEHLFNVTARDETDDEYTEDIDDEVSLMRMMGNDYDISSNKYQIIFDLRWPNLKKHLFNIPADPEERVDLKDEQPQLVEDMRLIVRDMYASFVERDYPDKSKRGSPRHFNNIWSPGWC